MDRLEDTGRSVNMALASSGGGGGDGPMEKADKLVETDDSSDSENDEGDAKAFHRRISTNKEIKNGVCIKEGYLMKQTSSFQRWQRRYFKLKGRKLYYGKDPHCLFYDEVELAEVSVAEKSVKNVNHTFQVISPFRNLVLCAESRKEMEDWILALKSTMNQVFYDPNDHHAMMSGLHNWYVSSHARPTYCNVCREALSGVTFHGLSCGVCKFKAHKKCAVKAPNNCKWITLANVGNSIIENEDRTLSMCHQWLEGNLPVSSAKCSLCDKTCGSVRRLQDWRCLWCKATVHSACKDLMPEACPLCQCHISIVPPTAIHSIDSDGFWEASRPPGTSPLLVFVNSKSGDNQGVKFLRRFKQLLNPAQVFDLMNGGPYPGLRLFQRFDQFRILVCGGDGSIGWVLSEIDKLDLQRQCQIGVLPLGTGNDLARVLGWGSVMTDDNQLLSVIEKLEHSQIKMLDRWSIMVYEEHELPILMKGNHSSSGSGGSGATRADDAATSTAAPDGLSTTTGITDDMIARYEDSVADHLSKILHSTDHSTVISSAKVLCETVRNFVTKVTERQHEAVLKPTASADDTRKQDSIADKCANLHSKLDLLLGALGEEESSLMVGVERGDREMPDGGCSSSCVGSSTSSAVAGSFALHSACYDNLVDGVGSHAQESFHLKEIVMSRANSIKKSVRQIIEQTEKAVDEQNSQMEDLHLVAQQQLRSQSRDRHHSRPGAGSSSIEEGRHSQSSGPTAAPGATSSFDAHSGSRTVSKPYAAGGGPHPAAGYQRQQSVPRSPQSSDHRASGSKSPRSPSRRISAMSTLAPAAAAVSRDRSPEGVGSCYGSGGLSSSSTVPPWLPLTTSLRVNSSIASNLAGGSFISKMLLANADALCACASPLVEDSVSLENYEEKCVMNNYFGVGLDAKIALEFHNKREEHPEKCRSRTKNMMWFGVIGGKEIIQQTYKNLEQRVLLECDGQQLPLPNLQGIVVLNIPSYMGGANFWGSSRYKEGEQTFVTQSFDDRILEVVAVFGSAQLGVSRIVSLQHHRIAQCRTVKITIKGDEPVPVQVDGEAWLQPPGFIRIVHKNRAQMLTRDRSFETTLRQWSEKQKILGGGGGSGGSGGAATAGHSAAAAVGHERILHSGVATGVVHQPRHLPLTLDELETVGALAAAATVLVDHVKASPVLLTEDARALTAQLELCLERARAINKQQQQTKSTKDHVLDLIDRAKLLCNEVSHTLGNDCTPEQDNSMTVNSRAFVLGTNGALCDVMANVDIEAQKLAHLLLQDAATTPVAVAGGAGLAATHGTHTCEETRRKHHRFNIVSRFRSIAGGGNGSGRRMADKDRPSPPASCSGADALAPTPPCCRAYEWTIDDIGSWLSSMGMAEYKETFARNDIRGPELLQLERKDLKDLGISKVGHLKRLQRAIEEMAATATVPSTAGGSIGSGSPSAQQPLLLSS